MVLVNSLKLNLLSDCLKDTGSVLTARFLTTEGRIARKKTNIMFIIFFLLLFSALRDYGENNKIKLPSLIFSFKLSPPYVGKHKNKLFYK